MAEATVETIRNFATVLIERADNMELFVSVLESMIKAARDVALDDAYAAIAQSSAITNKANFLTIVRGLKADG